MIDETMDEQATHPGAHEEPMILGAVLRTSVMPILILGFWVTMYLVLLGG